MALQVCELCLCLSGGDGRVMVEVKQTSDLFPPERAEQLIQVNSPAGL